jgi:uncharacterized protein YsxB (DUF464 family)
LVEIIVERDEENRICSFQGRQIIEDVAGLISLYLVRAAVASLSDYLYLESSFYKENAQFSWLINRSATSAHLNREIDAILETVLCGLKLLEHDYPAELVVQDMTADVGVA